MLSTVFLWKQPRPCLFRCFGCTNELFSVCRTHSHSSQFCLGVTSDLYLNARTCHCTDVLLQESAEFSSHRHTADHQLNKTVSCLHLAAPPIPRATESVHRYDIRGRTVRSSTHYLRARLGSRSVSCSTHRLIDRCRHRMAFFAP